MRFENKKISCIQPRPSPKMSAIFDAVEKGFPNAVERNRQADCYLLWGLIGNNYQMMKTFPKQFVFTDMPYHGRLQGDDYENSFWRWSPCSFHFQDEIHAPSDRFEKWNVELKPWKEEGDFILICPSSETMTKVINGMNQDRWIQTMYDKIKPHTNKPIKVRLKPRKNGTSGPAAETVSMKEELVGCHALVTNASLTAIEALQEGVPVFSDTSECPSAWVTNRDFRKINTPDKHDREQLFYDLAYRQFSIRELRDGTAYEIISKYFYN